MRPTSGDHPRVCGEQCTTQRAVDSVKGSPPRVRGTVIIALRRSTRKRITPACAGNRKYFYFGMLPGEDHPRVCGEQAWALSRKFPPKGSPPRVRGTDGHARGDGYGLRITPACAGNRATKRRPLPLRQDHPRVCGEQVCPSGPCGPLMGSPPRVRGTGPVGGGGKGGRRITPACAGNSPAEKKGRKPKDHPRVCGEQPMAGTRGRQKQGSPPRVRGTGG